MTTTKKWTEAELDALEAEIRAAPPRSDEEIAAGVAADPDAAPLNVFQTLKRARIVYPMPDLKALRERLGMTQAAFASAFSIPVNNVRDWEQGHSRPDAATAAYLRVIAREPEMVQQALRPDAA